MQFRTTWECVSVRLIFFLPSEDEEETLKTGKSGLSDILGKRHVGILPKS